MKKRVLSVVMTICLMISAFSVFEFSFEAHALACSCGAGTGTHKSWCETKCNCGSTTSGTHQETCPAYSCANSAKDTYKGCSYNASTDVTTHSRMCKQFRQACPGVGASTGCTSTEHKIGCPLYKPNSENTSTIICSKCGWLFGEHYVYCRDNPSYKSLSEVGSYNLYMPGKYTQGTGSANATYDVNSLVNGSVKINGLSAADIEVIKAAYDKSVAANSSLSSIKVCYRKLPDGALYEDVLNYTGGGTVSRDIHIPEHAIVVLDLNGNRIWGTGTGPAITNYGTLIILDSAPLDGCSGVLQDRGYYYFDDQSGNYFHSVRNAENAIWKQGLGGNVTIYGGVIMGGRTTRNNTRNGNSTVNVDSGKTYEELLARAQITTYNDQNRYYFTYLVENNLTASRYGFGGGGIHNEGTVIMNGGNIVGCESMNGEGAAVNNRGTNAKFQMNGGSVMYNFGGSIINAEQGAAIEIKNGKIFRNVGVGNGAVRGYSPNTASKVTITIGESTDTPDLNTEILNKLNTLDPSVVKNMGDRVITGNNYTGGADYLTDTQAGLFNSFHQYIPKVPLIAYNRSLSEIQTSGCGGGIYAESCILNLNAAIITQNWAHYRAGGLDIFNEGDVTLSGNVVIDSNYCEYKGGGIAVREPNGISDKLNLKITSENVKITNNIAAYGGGLYLSYGDFTMSAGEVSNNRSIGFYISADNYNYPAYTTYPMNGTTLTWGGKTHVQAIDFDGKVTDLSANEKRTTSHGGGGIYMEGDTKANATISGSAKIINNSAYNYGGGMYLSKGDVTMEGGTFSGNYIRDDKLAVNSANTVIGVNDSRGGALCVQNGHFKMNGGTFHDNHVKSTQGDGAGIMVVAPLDKDQQYPYAFEMHGGTIYNNTNADDQGGGVYVEGNVLMTGGEVYNNTACDNGGGYYVCGGEFLMTGGKIYNNTAKNYIGGGVYVHQSNFNMSGGQIYNNKAETRNGGGVYVRNGNFKMTAGEITGNTAMNTSGVRTSVDQVGTQFGSGGGICVQNGTVDITGNSIIENNKAAFKGGAIYTFSSAGVNTVGQTRTVTIGTTSGAEQPRISSNNVTMPLEKGDYRLGGGAICVEGKDAKFVVNNAEISNNTLVGEHCDGGAILMLEGTTDESNTTSEQSLKGTSTVIINNVNAHHNRAESDHGGFLAVINGTVTINDGKFNDNYAFDNGGAIYHNEGTITIDADKDGGVDIYNNSAEHYVGGAIYIENGLIDMYGGNIYNNKVINPQATTNLDKRGHGGAIDMLKGTFKMYNGAIYNNIAGEQVKGDGGAISVRDTGDVYIYGGSIGVDPNGNPAGNIGRNGGAIAVNNGDIFIGKQTCDGTTDEFHNSQDPTDSKCGHPIIANNTATLDGGALYSAAGTTTFYCGAMTKNTATNKGGGMYVSGGDIRIEHGTVRENESQRGEAFGDSLYMNGGKVSYTTGGTFANKNGSTTGVVVAGGELEMNGATTLVSVYFKERGSETIYQEFKVPAGTQIVLPEGADIFGEYENQTFIGWQYPIVDDYIRNDGDVDYGYKLSGTSIQAKDNSGTGANTMTLYGVWANDVNSISYYSTHTENSGITTTDAYDTSYRYDTPKEFTLPTPTLAPNYTFMGWTMQQGIDCETNCNANWGIPVDGEAKNAGDTLDTTGKFGNLHFYANWTTRINYYAVYDTIGIEGGSVQVNNASTTHEDIIVSKQTTVANGATAVANTNYTFIGWYTNADCTGEPVSTNVEYIPQVNANGYYDNLNYYAKFELQYKDLIIKTVGADADQTFVFTVEGQSGYAKNVKMQVIITTGNNGIATIKNIPAGKYKVYENNVPSTHQGDTWTWRYTDTPIKEPIVNGSLDDGESAPDTVTFNYHNGDNSTPGKKNVHNWLNGLSQYYSKMA